MATSSDEIRLLLVGKTGKGKSTTGNNILGKKLFNTSPSASSVTKDCELRRNMRNGTMIEVMDAPGLFDTGKSQGEILVHILKAVACMIPGPHAVLFVLSIERFTKEEYEAYTALKTAFDTNITKYIILIFTNGERLQEMPFKEWLKTAPKELKNICAEVENRCMAINNFAKEPEMKNNIDTLLQKVRNLIHANRRVPYSCPKYAKVGEEFEHELNKRLEKVELKALQKSNAYKNQLAKDKKVLQQEKEKVEKERQDFERKKRQQQKMLQEEQEKHQQQKAKFEKEKERKEYELKERERERKRREDEEEMRKEWLEKERCLKEKEERLNKEDEKRQEMTRRMKDEIAENKNPTFWSKLGTFIVEGVGYVVEKFVGRLIPL